MRPVTDEMIVRFMEVAQRLKSVSSMPISRAREWIAQQPKPGCEEYRVYTIWDDQGRLLAHGRRDECAAAIGVQTARISHQYSRYLRGVQTKRIYSVIDERGDDDDKITV